MADKAPGRNRKSGGGYGRPPREHQFEKGKSGNPKGRPKGSRNFGTDVKKMLKRAVLLDRDGTKQKVSTQEALLIRLREKALKGDSRALQLALTFAQHFNGDLPAVTEALPPDDRALLEAFAARVLQSAQTPATAQTRTEKTDNIGPEAKK